VGRPLVNPGGGGAGLSRLLKKFSRKPRQETTRDQILLMRSKRETLNDTAAATAAQK